MSILFLLASLGVVNGMLLSIYLMFRKQNTVSDAYFGGLLLALSLRIGKSVFFYFSETVDLLILQIGLSACVFIGPCFYLYVKSVQQPVKHFQRKDIGLLLALLLGILSIGLKYPYRSFPEVWNGYIVYGIYALWFVFTIAALYQLRSLLKAMILSPRKLNQQQQYLAIITVALLLITLTYQTALFVGFTYIWGALIFSLAFYYLLGKMLLVTKSLTPTPPDPPLENGPQLLKQLNTLMAEHKPFTNPKLKLDELATQAQLSKHTLSRLLNEEYQQGFSQYVKEYRVREAQQLIVNRHELSLEGIGYEAGFNSKSAFFEAFKKIAHCTPAQYKRSQEQPI